VLVNNAGIALDGSAPSQSDLTAFKATYQTNVFGAFEVTQAMLPLLKRSPEPAAFSMMPEQSLGDFC
jgi:NAD(P)-dependent dehydrogenase (short-subunit alcohol dehydrogenase family)